MNFYSDYKVDILQRICIYIVAICLVLGNGCVYTHFSGAGHLDAIITYAPIGILLILLVLRKQVSKRGTIISVIMVCYLGIYALVSGANLKTSFFEIMLVAVLIIYIFTFEKDKTAYLLVAYRDVIFWVALVSVIMWLLCSVLKVIPSSGTSYSVWGPSVHELKNFYNIYFERDRQWLFGSYYVCNRSIFVERAFAAFSFSIGWIYELFIEKRVSKIRRLVFAVAMFSTLSMTALIVILITYTLYYIFNGKNKQLLQFFKIILIPIVLFAMYSIISALLETKMSMGHSYSSRLGDLFNGISAWKQSPIYGFGFGNTAEIESQFKTGYSNSISAILTQGGIMLMVLYVFSLSRGIIASIRNRETNNILFIVVFSIIVSVTAIAFRNTTVYVFLYICFLISDINTQEEDIIM